MKALARLVRTTAFKLSAVFLVVFALFAALILGYVSISARRLLEAQIVETLEAEVNGLSEQYRAGGIPRLVAVVDRRARQPGAFLYSVQGPLGQQIAGNVSGLPPDVMARPGTRETPYQRLDESGPVPQQSLARVFFLPGGFKLLVGRDLEERRRLEIVIRRASRLSLALILFVGLVGALLVARRVLRRIDGMTETTKRIMAGDLAGRLPVVGSNDELDRLAQNLNAMLERIGELMRGMKEVSDNIAHDLKTPLTRLKNSAEQALRTATTPDEYRAALERTIEESDGLIRTFDALLMIARAEAGNSTEGFTECDVGEVLTDVGELYEPAAEEAGAELVMAKPAPLLARANRELLGQAIANLIDNALKYGVPARSAGAQPAGRVTLGAERTGDRIRLVVADAGEGIPEADRIRVAERFVRLDASRGKPGSGLGLSLVAAIARLHGGHLTFEDGRPGLRAVITLPATVSP